ncbi:DUF6888 family protein [Nostoc sp. DedQUE07]|uniref:DUF6888 family protein n=1 Tax=Nostoc sp. DedQUE07 TaxID=3075392 RepID=UPI00391B1F0C
MKVRSFLFLFFIVIGDRESTPSLRDAARTGKSKVNDIALVRFDERTSRIVILIGETIQVEILSNGENIIR